MQSYCIYWSAIVCERVALFMFLQEPSVSGLIEESWFLVSVSAFWLLWTIVLVEVHKDSLASHRYVLGKQQNILVPFQKIVDIVWPYTETQQVVVS